MRAIQLFFLCLFLVVCAVVTSAGRGLGSLWGGRTPRAPQKLASYPQAN